MILANNIKRYTVSYCTNKFINKKIINKWVKFTDGSVVDLQSLSLWFNSILTLKDKQRFNKFKNSLSLMVRTTFF